MEMLVWGTVDQLQYSFIFWISVRFRERIRQRSMTVPSAECTTSSRLDVLPRPAKRRKLAYDEFPSGPRAESVGPCSVRACAAGSVDGPIALTRTMRLGPILAARFPHLCKDVATI